MTSVVEETRGRLAVIRGIDPERDRVTVEYRSGETGWFTRPPELDIEIGSLWLIGDGTMSPAEEDLWPDRSTFAVVAEVLGDALVIEHQGRLQRLSLANADAFTAGSTIELDVLGTVVGVVSKRPLRPYGLGDPEEDPIARFRRPPTGGGPGFESFGGYGKVVDRARELVEAPLHWRGELDTIGARPVKGVLFSGPPGTGKTKLASLIANESSAAFYEVSGPAIVSKWVGDSEKALRSLFEEARSKEAAIIFFDEIDSIAGRRDGDSQEFSRRVVAQLLIAMDGFASDTNVVVIGATNRIGDIDPALRRPGRFDWVVEFPMPNRQDREAILRVSADALTTEGPLPHTVVADRTEGWAPADLTAILTEAALLAVKDNGRSAIMAEDYLGGFARLIERQQLAASMDAREAS
jgi:transitional endoplasmic reticulum ATPase